MNTEQTKKSAAIAAAYLLERKLRDALESIKTFADRARSILQKDFPECDIQSLCAMAEIVKVADEALRDSRP
jgi:hypothetical protein